jgi:hypothetical protein
MLGDKSVSNISLKLKIVSKFKKVDDSKKIETRHQRSESNDGSIKQMPIPIQNNTFHKLGADPRSYKNKSRKKSANDVIGDNSSASSSLMESSRGGGAFMGLAQSQRKRNDKLFQTEQELQGV